MRELAHGLVDEVDRLEHAFAVRPDASDDVDEAVELLLSALLASVLMLVTRLRACLSVMARHDCTASTRSMSPFKVKPCLSMAYLDGLRWYVFNVDVERAQHLDVGVDALPLGADAVFARRPMICDMVMPCSASGLLQDFEQIEDFRFCFASCAIGDHRLVY